MSTVNTRSSTNVSATEQSAGGSSDLTTIKQALHAQQELNEKHEKEVSDIKSTLESMMKLLQAQAASGRQAAEPAENRPEVVAVQDPVLDRAVRIKETKTPDVDPYYGDRNKLDFWENALEFKFRNEPLRFSTEEAKLNYVVAMLKGDAAAWLTAFLDKDKALLFKTLGEFSKAIHKRFGDQDAQGTAERKLMTLKQTGSAVAYATEFVRLTTILEYPDRTKKAFIVKGLKRELRMAIAIQDMPEDFEDFVNRIIRMDNGLSMCKASVSKVGTYSSDGNKHQAEGLTNKTEPAMQPRTKRLSDEEYQRRKDNNLCLKCGKAGHSIRECPDNPYSKTRSNNSNGDKAKNTEAPQ